MQYPRCRQNLLVFRRYILFGWAVSASTVLTMALQNPRQSFRDNTGESRLKIPLFLLVSLCCDFRHLVVHWRSSLAVPNCSNSFLRIWNPSFLHRLQLRSSLVVVARGLASTKIDEKQAATASKMQQYQTVVFVVMEMVCGCPLIRSFMVVERGGESENK